MSTTPLTVRGAERLKEELTRLKHVERPSVINAIAEARAQGDLSENAEYDAAKERQGSLSLSAMGVSCLVQPLRWWISKAIKNRSIRLLEKTRPI